MLLDEPYTHLDAPAARRLREEFETHWQLDPRTYLLVTHDIDEAVLLADRVSVMSRAPAHIMETVEVDVGRPRTVHALTTPGARAAIARIWDVLDRASQ
jgi:ABC-type nitrate/sulfonate/bicarbonate transport system ATPase subunit